MSHLFKEFSVQERCLTYGELLHYTTDNVLRIILNDHTLLCNSITNVNDLLEKKRLGLDGVVGAYYTACFCHNQHEIVPFWYLYGRSRPKERRVLLRFKNFASRIEDVFDRDVATTSDNKILFFDPKFLYTEHSGSAHFTAMKTLSIENHQTIGSVQMIDVEYLDIDNEAFYQNYRRLGSVSFGETTVEGVPILDATTIGRQKTVNWEYEAETRLLCRLSPMTETNISYFYLRMNEEIFNGLRIVVNPWATDEFVRETENMVSDSSLSDRVKSTIVVSRSELDKQIKGD